MDGQRIHFPEVSISFVTAHEGDVSYERTCEGICLWGGVIIVFSFLGILGGMGGFMIGLVLGIVGGALALAWSPTPKTALSTPTILSS